jgi:hypothetical protein
MSNIKLEDATTVFSPNGEQFEVDHRNARELVAYSGFTFSRSKPVEIESDPEPTAPVVEVVEASVGEQAVAEFTVAETLADEAEKVTGKRDVEDWLSSYSIDALRTMAEERYGIKARSNTTKPTLIAKMIEAGDGPLD